MGAGLRTVLACLLVTAGIVLLSGCSGAPKTDIPDPTGFPQDTARASVFFSTGRTVVEEPRILDANDVYGQVFAAFLAARPEINAEIAIVQPEATIRSVTVVGTELTIDWSREVLAFEATDSEKTLALAAILLNAGQFPELETVRFTVEGQTTGELDGKDIEYFWGKVSLRGQPFDAIRPPETADKARESTSTAGSESGAGTEPGATTTMNQ